MIDLLKKLLNKRTLSQEADAPGVKRTAMVVPPLVLREGATLPIVEWDALDAHAPLSDGPAALDEYWTAVAHSWIKQLGCALSERYTIVESEHFLLLSPLEARAGKAILEFTEKTRRRILMLLDGIARNTEMGKVCLLIFEDDDTYYRYVSHYYPEDGEFAQSGGMFIQAGYGHFVFAADDMNRMEPTVAHELTHCLMQHLPIPAWLNEGLAVNTERRLIPPLGAPLYTPEELHEKHIGYWNASTIQEFWSGKSWNRAGDSNKLSYDLATHFVRLASADMEAFRGFVNAANNSDGGASAAEQHLGFPVERFAQAVLGEGDWTPKPATWAEGVERGQF